MSAADSAARPTPVLGLVVGLRRPALWDPFVVALTEWCEPRLADGTGTPPSAWLASSADAPGLRAALSAPGPVAVLSAAPDAGELAAAALVWTGKPEAAPDVEHVLCCSAHAVDTRSAWPLTPFVRSRWRAARGLPRELVVDTGEVEDALRATSVALASAVVATYPGHLVEALAWGAPCVTDAGTAAEVDALDGSHVVVASGRSLLRSVASALGADHRRGAVLGRRGRRLVEERHDLSATAAAVARRLGLVPRVPGLPALAPLSAQLDRLSTPATARIRARCATAVSALGAGTGAQP